MSTIENNETLLRVEHLCQYFKMGDKVNKAVDDVSFDIKKGEVFGLVGESGCGKTTTGRSIIKIYDITSGSVYFKGQRICAGTQSYKDAVKDAKKELKDNPSAQRRQELEEIIRTNEDEIKRAKFDHLHSDEEYAKSLAEKLKEEYAPKLEAAKNDTEAYKTLSAKYRDDLRVAKKTKLITKIQMIFQDPI
ncbi:MAG: ATP-binding cassette domain-containing protein, partial [Eubacteriales bacterium]